MICPSFITQSQFQYNHQCFTNLFTDNPNIDLVRVTENEIKNGIAQIFMKLQQSKIIQAFFLQFLYLLPQFLHTKCFFHSVRYYIYSLQVGHLFLLNYIFLVYFFCGATCFYFEILLSDSYQIFTFSLSIALNLAPVSFAQAKGLYLIVFSSYSLNTSSISSTQISKLSLKQYFLIQLQKISISKYSYFLKYANFSQIYLVIFEIFYLCCCTQADLFFFTSSIKLSKKIAIQLIKVAFFSFKEHTISQCYCGIALKSSHLFILSFINPLKFCFSYIALGIISLIFSI